MTSNDNQDPAAKQLEKWKEENKDKKFTTTTSEGIGIVYKDSSLTIGPGGPIPLQDWHFLEQMAHFDRERIPERVVHAKGAGAFGYFEVTDDISDLTISRVFEKVGKKTPIAIRFSQVAGNLGSADTVRDPRGFAIKFYTEEGIWDLVGNNTPIFFMRDPILFPMFIHSQKRNPVTNLRDWNMFWDYLSSRPECAHQVMFLFSDRGIPDGHRHMHGFGSHTFSLVDKNQKLTYVKFHHLTDQGIKNLPVSEATRIAGEEPDYALRDLYNAIDSGEFPSWTTNIQTMTPEQAEAELSNAEKNEPGSFDPFDITKVWPHKQYPLRKVGKLVLNRNPSNYFAEVEQIAFSPSNITPGIWISPDRLLQGRLFSYPDTHRYRLGPNFAQLPVNCPYKVSNFQRDGQNTINNQGGAPNYHPNSFNGPEVDPNAKEWFAKPEKVNGEIDYYDLKDHDNYSQPKVFYQNVLDDAARGRLIDNLASTIKLASENIQENAVKMFSNIDEDLGNRIKAALRSQNAKKH